MTRAAPTLRRGLSVMLILALLGPGAPPASAQQSEADVFVAQAILAYEDKRFEEALGLLREALQIDPDNVDGLYYSGLVYIALQRLSLAIQTLAQALTKSPGDIAILFQLGVTYFSQERYDRAEPLLTQVFTQRPQTDSVGYYVGFMRYRRKDYRGAIQAFTAGTASDPNIQQLTRFYAGLAFAILGLPERAAAEVDAALRAQPVSPLTGPAERLRDTLLVAKERERRFRGEVRVGFVYDTNVAVNPEPSHDPTAESLRFRTRKSPGELGAVNLSYKWLKEGPWEGTVGYGYFQIMNNTLPSFNIQDHLASAGATYGLSLGDMRLQTGAQYIYDYLILDDDEFNQRNTGVLFGTLQESSMHLTTAQARLQAKEFSSDSNTTREESRDGYNWMAGLTHVLVLEGGQHLARLGYQFDIDDVSGRNFKYRGHRISAGAQYTLPWNETRIRYDYDAHFRNYRHAHTILPANAPGTRERKDLEQVHVVRVEQPLPMPESWRKLNLGEVTLSAEYQATISRSNLPVFSFNRNVFSLILSWQY